MKFIIDAINKFLDGKKTIIGIIVGVGTFLCVLGGALIDGFQMSDIEVIGGGFSALMIAIGLQHKAKKIEDAIKK